jgi:D-tyrosyl-tRNA(Tyr) deacylase
MKARPVDATVEAIHHALTARRPKARYTVGSDARQLELLRKLPTSVRDRALMSAVGMRAAASRTPSAA